MINLPEVLPFVKDNLILCSAFLFVFLMLIFEETKLNVVGLRRVSPKQVVDLLNANKAVVLDIRKEEFVKKGRIIGSVFVNNSAESVFSFFNKNLKNKRQSNNKRTKVAQGNNTSNVAKTVVIAIIGSNKDAKMLYDTAKKSGFLDYFDLCYFGIGLAPWEAEGLPVIRDIKN